MKKLEKELAAFRLEAKELNSVHGGVEETGHGTRQTTTSTDKCLGGSRRKPVTLVKYDRADDNCNTVSESMDWMLLDDAPYDLADSGGPLGGLVGGISIGSDSIPLS